MPGVAAGGPLRADKLSVNDLLALLHLPPAGLDAGAPELRLQAVSSRSGAELLPALAEAIDRACGWVLHRRMVSASALQLRLETQGRGLMDLYASFIEQGLELSRDSHLMLTERCSCAQVYGQGRRGLISMSLDISLSAEPRLLRKESQPKLV